MLKQIVAIILLSIAVVMGMLYAQQGLQLILSVHNWISNLLTNVFSGGEAGNVSRQLIALLAVPLLVSLVPVIICWLAKRKWFPYFMELIWVLWLIQTSALIVLYKAGS